jgi:hypothetical protein
MAEGVSAIKPSRLRASGQSVPNIRTIITPATPERCSWWPLSWQVVTLTVFVILTRRQTPPPYPTIYAGKSARAAANPSRSAAPAHGHRNE